MKTTRIRKTIVLSFSGVLLPLIGVAIAAERHSNPGGNAAPSLSLAPPHRPRSPLRRYSGPMAAQTKMTVEEYLRTSFEEQDQEYVDGEVIARSTSPWEHARVQQLLILVFGKWMSDPGLFAVPELRERTSDTRFRIPDISVYLGPAQRPPIDRPPFIAIEILSPDDKMDPLLAKFEEYRAWGVAHIWLVNPMARTLHSYTSDGLLKQTALRIPEFSLSIPPEEVFPPECVSQ